MKAVLVVGDGMADRPLEELGWRTPLEAALKPTLNRIAEAGVCGIMDPISPGLPPGSDVAMLTLLGYDAFRVYSGRGALEAVGSGVSVSPEDVCFRCNFATVDESLTVLDRRAGGIGGEDAFKLAESLKEVRPSTPSIEVVFKNTVQHRAVLILKGAGLSAAVSDSDPKKVGGRALDVRPLDDSPEAKFTAEIVNELLRKFREVLKGHPVNVERAKLRLPPANIVLLRGAGTLPNLKTLRETYGVTSACISAIPLVKGVCKLAGMQLIDVKGATGTPQTDYVAKAEAAIQALKTNDLVLLHVKAPDVVSHDGNAERKVEVIEKIDQMINRVLDNVDLSETYLAVTADHTTSCLTRDHEGDPVPLAIMGPYVRRDDVREFSERACAKGGLGRIKGIDLMPVLMNLIGKAKKFGA